MHRSVGRPARWHKPIIEYVEKHGLVRARELRVELGIPERSLYCALSALVYSGALCWRSADSGNYRLIQKQVTAQRLDILLCSRN